MAHFSNDVKETFSGRAVSLRVENDYTIFELKGFLKKGPIKKSNIMQNLYKISAPTEVAVKRSPLTLKDVNQFHTCFHDVVF